MTRIEQTVHLARRVADRMSREIITETSFYSLLHRGGHFSPANPRGIRAADNTLWHQVEYAQAHFSPDDLQHQATELLTAVLGNKSTRITSEETTQICEGRTIFNGCTDIYLKEKYGEDRIVHIMGDGWYLIEKAEKDD